METSELDSPIRVSVLFSKPIVLNEERFMSVYRQEWENPLMLTEIPQWGNPAKGIKAYLTSDGVHSAKLTYCPIQIPQHLLLRSLELSNIKEPQEVEKYKSHASFIDVHFAMSLKETSSLDKVRFINRLLHVFAMMEETIGFINISAQLVRSWADYLEMSKQAQSNDVALFYLFVSIQIERNGEFWMHTHGMEQFDLPDIECWYKNEEESSYYWEIIGDAVLYMFKRGPILKIGDTFSYEDGDEIFEIVEPKVVEGHEFGREGAIGIKRKK